MIKSLHLLLGPPGDLLPTDILSLDILTSFSASILITFWSHSLLFLLLLLSTHSLIGWIAQDFLISWLLILSTFVLSTIFHSNPMSFVSNFCLFECRIMTGYHLTASQDEICHFLKACFREWTLIIELFDTVVTANPVKSPYNLRHCHRNQLSGVHRTPAK